MCGVPSRASPGGSAFLAAARFDARSCPRSFTPSAERSITTVTPAGAVLSHKGKGSPVKTRMAFVVVVIGALVLALAIGDGSPWPGFG